MRIGIKVLGCPKNTADCEILAGVLKSRGHTVVSNVEDADAVIIDTCVFIEDAKRETIDTIMDFVNYKVSRRPDLKILVKGCMVQRYYRELKEEIPEVDAWLGVLPPEKIADAVEYLEDSVGDPDPIYRYTARSDLDERPYSYVKIADGCDRNCTFCAIPLFKGRYRSRDPEDVESEVRDLISSGKKEIILVSQDSTAYGSDVGTDLPSLLKRLNSIKGDFWIRVMYLHPDHISEEILESMVHLEKVLPYFDIPFQHGSDAVLSRMGRIKRSSELMKLVNRIRLMSAESTIRTTVMVGFPGEREEDFQKLIEFLEDVHPDRMGVFVYSDEEGTVASGFRDKVPREIAIEREEVVTELVLEYTQESNERWIGKVIEVLVDEPGIGRGWMDAPEIDTVVFLDRGTDVGSVVGVKIVDLEDIDMKGKVVYG